MYDIDPQLQERVDRGIDFDGSNLSGVTSRCGWEEVTFEQLGGGGGGGDGGEGYPHHRSSKEEEYAENHRNEHYHHHQQQSYSQHHHHHHNTADESHISQRGEKCHKLKEEILFILVKISIICFQGAIVDLNVVNGNVMYYVMKLLL